MLAQKVFEPRTFGHYSTTILWPGLKYRSQYRPQLLKRWIMLYDLRRSVSRLWFYLSLLVSPLPVEVLKSPVIAHTLLNMSLIIVEFLEDVANVDKSRSPKVEHLPSLVKTLKWPLKVLFPGKVH